MNTFQSRDSSQLSDIPDILWQELKHRDLRYKFKQKFDIDHLFVVDFYCPEFKLVVEVTNTLHTYSTDKESWLLSHGYTLLRFTSSQVSNSRKAVVDKIFRVCLHLSSLL